MYRLLHCLHDQHSPSLVAIAAAICVASSVVTLLLLEQAKGGPRIAWRWLAAAAFTSGTCVWSTHFVAMLAYDPGVLVSYRFDWTLGSLIVAIAMSFPALVLAPRPGSGSGGAASGLLLGVAIAATHNLGMLGVVVPGHFTSDIALVLASDAIGMAFSVAAFAAFARNSFGDGRSVATGCLFFAVCALHFVGMSSVTVVPDPTAPMAAWVVPREALAIVIASLVAVVLTLGTSALALSVRLAAAAVEIVRFRNFADAAIDGMASLRDNLIVDVNRSFVELVGVAADNLVGRPFQAVLHGTDTLTGSTKGDDAGAPIRLDLRGAGGAPIPVELFLRTVAFADGPRTVVSVRDLRERNAAEARIFFLAHHDALTGLGNRASLDERLLRCMGEDRVSKRSFAIHCIDLDRFKTVNDSLGHAAGDQVLRQVAERLRRALRPADEVYRLGGDEFVVVQAGVDGERDAAERLAARLVATLGEPYPVGEHALDVGATVGTALYPTDGVDPMRLLGYADLALYAAKARRRGSFQMFDTSLEAASRERLDFEARLRRAIVAGEFRLVYQPQIELRTGTAIGYEALLRWRNPTLGDVPPSRFIPIAEEIGMICALGEWALAAACREAAGWERPLKVSVNLSAAQFQVGDLVGAVQRILRTTGLDPARLELEITETMLIRDARKAALALGKLRDLGVSVALDDFGQGYSSLSYLQRFPFDVVKIDRSFVAGLGTDAASLTILRAVVDLGRALGVRVVAEGIEKPSQLDLLRKLNCYAAQGFLLGSPREAAAVEATEADYRLGPVDDRLRLIA